MIRPLRSRHRVMVFSLAVCLPILFWAGLLARGSGAGAVRLDPALGGAAACLAVSWEDPDRWPGLAITTRVGRQVGDLEGPGCELEPRRSLEHPDVLLYWSAVPPAGALSEDAFLLGGWGDARRCFPLPAEFETTPGHLTLFSLAHGQILASASLER